MQLNPNLTSSQALEKSEFQQAETERKKGVSKHARIRKASAMFLAKQERGQREIRREVEKGRLKCQPVLGDRTPEGCTVWVWTSLRK